MNGHIANLHVEQHHGFMRIVLSFACLLILTSLLTLTWSTSAQATESPDVQIPVHQVFLSDTNGITGNCQYRLVADSADAPMPAGSENNTYNWSMTGNEDSSLAISCTKVGTYVYTMQQVSGGLDGYTYDTTTYTVRIFAWIGADDSIAAVGLVYNTDGNKVTDPAWTLEYRQPAQPVDPNKMAKTGDDLSASAIVLSLGALGCGVLAITLHTRRRIRRSGCPR